MTFYHLQSFGLLEIISTITAELLWVLVSESVQKGGEAVYIH